ncbi:MAG: nudix hydrolase chloroplastic-like [Trebouxia sp. A1-2]|nr:MAG: nudix hydrolase chloroplastic-like [Trebouxia sp. A1-2]
MTSLRLSGGVASRTCQVFVRALRVPPLASRHLTTQPMQSQLTHRSILSYEGKNCGFRSSSIAACAQRGNASSAPVPQKPEKTKDQYCRMCGTQMELAIPKGEAAWRHMCSNCGYIDYLNPKMVVGCIVEHEGKILLCKRGIEPCKGKWTLPAGYMELKESSADNSHATGNFRNLLNETARLAAPYSFSPGEETVQTELFQPKDIPFDQASSAKTSQNKFRSVVSYFACTTIAFSSISLALQYYVEDMQLGQYRIHHGVVSKQPGSGPNEAGRFQLQDHFAVKTEVPVLDSKL